MSGCNIYSFEKRPCISPLTFSWYSNNDVRKNSAFHLQHSDDINDLHLGATIEDACLTCGNTWNTCPGHFGHYTLFYPLFHPLRTTQAKKKLEKNKKGKFIVKQNILNVKDPMKQWRCANVLDIDDYNATEYPFLVKELLISPPCLRPTCTTVNSKVSVSQNDITHRLGSLIRIDSTLRKAYELNPNNKEELSLIHISEPTRPY